jgi:hypothetical protein
VLVPALSAVAQELQVPDWVPSLGLGGGIQSRPTDGEIDALIFNNQPSTTRIVPCIPLGSGSPFDGFCDLSADDTRSLDGATLVGSAQLLGPPLRNVFLRPRPFVHGGFSWAFDSRTIAEAGFNPSTFEVENLNEPDIRTRLRGNPEYLWYVGGGVALQLPIELRPVFVKIGAHYMEEMTEVVGTIDRAEELLTSLQTTEFTTDLTIRGVGPFFGLEAELARIGPVALNAVGDVFMTFPLSGTDAEFDLDGPVFPGDVSACRDSPPGTVRCQSPAHFSYGADDIHWLGVAALRLTWVGSD